MLLCYYMDPAKEAETIKKFGIDIESLMREQSNLAEFRSYRELPAMLKALEQLEQKPELFLIDGLGINHPRLGEASHFSINTDIPSIAITDNSIGFNISDD